MMEIRENNLIVFKMNIFRALDMAERIAGCDCIRDWYNKARHNFKVENLFEYAYAHPSQPCVKKTINCNCK